RQFAQPFVPLVNGTMALNGFGFDEAQTIAIGFTFTYYGRAYDFIGIGENGAASFAQACIGSGLNCDQDEFCSFGSPSICERFDIPIESDGIPSPNTPNKILAPWWDDLSDTPSMPSASVTTALLGNAPNREFVIEWKNMAHNFNFGLNSMSRATFQIRLEETT